MVSDHAFNFLYHHCFAIWRIRRTGAGDAAVADMKQLFKRLKDRASNPEKRWANQRTGDVDCGVFGLSAVSASAFPFIEKIYLHPNRTAGPRAAVRAVADRAAAEDAGWGLWWVIESGWAGRGELAGGIFANLDRIDLVELIADDHFKSDAKGAASAQDASPRKSRSRCTAWRWVGGQRMP